MSALSSSARWVLVATALYLGGALWALRTVLPAPERMLPHALGAPKYWDDLTQGDQLFSVAKVTHGARLLPRAPQRLMEGGHCWPMPHATTLGEHMIGEGILGVVPDLLFHEPILTYNVVLILLPCIAGLAMYALVFAFTASAPAALVGGLLFALHPARLGNAAEPYWMGNHWTPLALLFAYRLFTRRRWLDAFGLALFTSLQLLDSFYPVVAFALVGGTYVLSLLVHERRALRSLAPKLVVAALLVAPVALFVFVPYLQTRATWGTLLSGRVTALYAPRDLALGGRLYPGTVMTMLAVLGLVDRLRGPRRATGHDPRVPLLAGGVLVLWAVLAEVPVPLLHLRIPSLLTLARESVPGLDAVRVGLAVSSGFYLVCALLAGFGARALLERSPAGIGHVAIVVLVVGAILEALHPRLALASFGRAVAFDSRLARPTDDALALYARAPDGAVLDLPAGPFISAEHMFLGAYHGHPTAACYGSFASPLWPDVVQLARRLSTDPNAAVALHALGFRTVATHDRLRFGKVTPPILPAGPHLTILGRTGPLTLYELDGADEVDADIAPLVAGGKELGPIEAFAGAASLAVPFRNGAPVTYRHPDPIAPSALRAQWYDANDNAVAQHLTRGLLPLVLVSGETATRQLDVPVPSVAGEYRLVLTEAAPRDRVLASIVVHVRPPPTPVAPDTPSARHQP